SFFFCRSLPEAIAQHRGRLQTHLTLAGVTCESRGAAESREIVLAAFLITFGAIGVAFAVAVGLGSARAIQRGWESLFDRPDEGRGRKKAE
ncbi:MAG: hypothetical protein OER90_04050, partial [Gemmatimonadota bacterium]|nr:hypothetical protein [Gemmatimonadota bacterium]